MGAKKRIICADDNFSDLHLFELACEELGLGYELIKAKNGCEAVEILQSEPEGSIDALILDMKMPRMTGLEALKKVRNEMDRDDLPIFLLSSSTMDRDINEAYEAGVNAYIVKPIDFFDFVYKIEGMHKFWEFLNQN